jgi:2'-5' RNA ligase
MVHSIELIFDRDTEAAVRRIWADLAAVGLTSATGRPHTTMVVAEQIAPDVDALLQALSQRLPLDCVIGAPLLFGRTKMVLARLVVPTSELIALHTEVHRLCLPHVAPAPMPNCLPGQWTAHVTLARRASGAQLGRALDVAGQPTEIHGCIAGLRRWDGDKKTEHLIQGM